MGSNEWTFNVMIPFFKSSRILILLDSLSTAKISGVSIPKFGSHCHGLKFEVKKHSCHICLYQVFLATFLGDYGSLMSGYTYFVLIAQQG